MVRKVGGFTFQELNLAIDDIKTTSERGADLSYDFVNRPAYHHALATGDTEFLRLTLNAALQHRARSRSRLVHALQNHDELTYELVHFATAHTGRRLPLPRDRADRRRARRSRSVPSSSSGSPATAAPVQRHLHHQRHRLHDGDGHRRGARHHRPDDARRRSRSSRSRRAHLLLAMFNAWQPGVVRAAPAGTCAGC